MFVDVFYGLQMEVMCARARARVYACTLGSDDKRHL
jgi:hypothetical protein